MVATNKALHCSQVSWYSPSSPLDQTQFKIWLLTTFLQVCSLPQSGNHAAVLYWIASTIIRSKTFDWLSSLSTPSSSPMLFYARLAMDCCGQFGVGDVALLWKILLALFRYCLRAVEILRFCERFCSHCSDIAWTAEILRFCERFCLHCCGRCGNIASLNITSTSSSWLNTNLLSPSTIILTISHHFAWTSSEACP